MLLHRVISTPARVLEQDTEFLLLSPFTSSPCEEGPSLNQNLTGLDSLAGTHQPREPGDDVTRTRNGAQLPTWVLGIQFAPFPEELLPTEPSPSPINVTVEQGYETHCSEPWLRISPRVPLLPRSRPLNGVISNRKYPKMFSSFIHRAGRVRFWPGIQV